MNTTKYCFILVFMTTLFNAVYLNLKANNIAVSNIRLTGQNVITHTAQINFDLGWENSWRTSTNERNYDGAWIFIKFRPSTTSSWRHATISNTGNLPGSGGSFLVSPDGKGAFLFRTTDGIGNINFADNKLQWNYGIDGLPNNEIVDLQVYALEMVYIPIGNYYLGSGGTEESCFKTGSTNSPYLVSSNNSIPLGTSGNLLNPQNYGPQTNVIPDPFPKGYNPFWIMKYECTEQQYADFLNNLDLSRATSNNLTYTKDFFTGTHPNLIPKNPTQPMAYVNHLRLAAFADWSGLRPMTELEYEKACRGANVQPVPNEYAWGNNTIQPLDSVDNQGLSNESVRVPVDANANVGSSNIGFYGAPTRVGIFARPLASTRTKSGSTYYGVMNMSDNLFEICVTIADTSGVKMDAAVHGDGYLALDGNSDISLFVTRSAYGVRGGNYNGLASSFDNSKISNRGGSSYPFGNFEPFLGIRLAHSAQ